MTTRTSRYVILAMFLVLFLLPFVWIWSSALKSNSEINADPFGLPTSPQWGNLADAWTTGRFGKYLGNTVLYCAFVVPGVTVLSCLAGYALGTRRLPGERYLLGLFLLGIMIPFQSIMVPQYYLVRDLDLLGSYWGVIVPSIALGLAFGTFLMRSFFRELPEEIGNAARLDGAGEWRVFSRIMLPLARPGLITMVVLQFMFTWNMFLIPLLYGQDENLRPVSTGIMFFIGEYSVDRSMIAAGVTLASVPIIVVYLVLQRHFIQGMTSGALK
ncbi:carbohydrate ABC transporter permease [Actinoallomurus iriomotensis]|uniref:Sugar ABC transporter permease n=1 Tax=Actinoallomurus iriomotensis TaxID=478107 RepID=A0A9W6VQA3_9ACTN|nr:carbohydrate ABC transporter permease [Actinoallomurus iriomotensis]GLY75262.1 sugar ABC transporter permease [Actinoallomurus iriomotensis]